MRNKLLTLAVSVAATVLLGSSAFGQACSAGATPQFIGAGASSQFNTFAYAAADVLGGVTNTSDWNIWTTKSAVLQDTRPSSTPTDTGLSLWIIWDNNATCNFYAFYSTDSGIAVKDFFAYKKITVSTTTRDVAAVYPTSTGIPCSSAGVSLIPGLTDTSLPGSTSGFLCQAITNPVVPTTTTSKPPAYCGQLGTPGTTTPFCYFNAAMTDLRPEDALYATQRALSVYTTTNSLDGLGYNQTACGGDGLATSELGCTLYDSFGQKKAFNVLRFAISGSDPFTSATVPTYSTLTTGAAPVVVFVNNGDTSTLGFGAGAPAGPYTFTDIHRTVLASIFDGTSHCTGDVLPHVPTAGSAGQPIQVVMREPLSGTYGVFEFTGIRTILGSASTAVGQNKISSSTWLTDDASGQELNNNPANGWSGGVLSSGCGGPGGSGGIPQLASAPCGDPVLITTGSTTNNGNGPANCGQGLRVRAITTGEEIKAGIGTYNSSTSPKGWSITDGIGYAYWGYSNFAPFVTSSNCTTQAGGNATCSSFSGHYLTVDAVDPIYQTEGGQYDPTPNPQPFNPPQCSLILGLGTGACAQIPFPHIFDGKYPLWSLLRAVTFSNVTNKQETPAGVINIIANAELEAAPGSTYQLSDFVPFLNSLCAPNNTTPPCNNTTSNWVGNLNLGVFRSHYKQTGGSVAPSNGYAACQGVFTGVSLQGGTHGSSACLVDTGNDVGGAVFTVQADVDFNADFGNLYLTSGKDLYEIYGLHQ
jgi:hypothetical protein